MNTQAGTKREEFSNQQRSGLLTEVDFKWLMAGIGIWVNPTKLHRDPTYAQANVQSALNSRCEPLRRCAARLQIELKHE